MGYIEPRVRMDRQVQETAAALKGTFRERSPIIDAQIDAFTRILVAGFGSGVDISLKRSHTSKSHALPILGGTAADANVMVTSMGDNFHCKFVGVRLRRPVPATLLYPISSLFGAYPLSSHTDPEGAPSITNFEKEYHNRTPIEAFGVACNSPLEAALLIRYLNEVSKLDHRQIFDAVLDATAIGKRDVIDGNYVDYPGLAAAVQLVAADGKEITYFGFDADGLPGIIRKMGVKWIDTDNRGSSLDLELNVPLPRLPIPYNAVLVPTSEEQQASGLAKAVPARFLRYKEDHPRERHEMCQDGNIADQYHRAEWDNMKWVINTPNPLDLALTAFMLTKVLPVTMEIL